MKVWVFANLNFHKQAENLSSLALYFECQSFVSKGVVELTAVVEFELSYPRGSPAVTLKMVFLILLTEQFLGKKLLYIAY